MKGSPRDMVVSKDLTDLMTAAQSESLDAIRCRKLADVERIVILRTLSLCKGNRTRAAANLDITVRTLYTKLKKYRDDAMMEREHEENKRICANEGSL